MNERDGLDIVWHPSVREIPASEWNALALPLETPFLEHGWLTLLESSGAVCPATGWVPKILAARRRGKLVAACPLYRKSHSEGEFVFDYLWAEAAAALRVPYYPKLVGMSPVTPVGAVQWLIAPEVNREETAAVLGRAALDLCAAEGMTGLHFQYAHPDWVKTMRPAGFAVWEHPCFLWSNDGYDTFDDFLAGFSKNGRRNIRREEKSLAAAGVSLRVFEGDEIPVAWHRTMYRYYLATNEKFGPWAALYLTEDFFRGLFRDFRHRLAVSAAFAAGEAEPIALALLLHKGGRLWGRYWGARFPLPNLHFNVCYYAPIRWAIERGITSYDPGIGGEHKARRGFRARAGYSLHRLLDPRLDEFCRLTVGKMNTLTRRSIENQNSGRGPDKALK